MNMKEITDKAMMDIYKAFVKSNGELSEDEENAVQNLLRICTEVLSMTHCIRTFNNWKEMVETEEES